MMTLQFACQQGCVDCCKTEGYVYITEKDLVRIARFLKMTPADFEARYVYRTRHLLRLRKPGRGKQCHFLKDGFGCTIHPVNPVQCRLYPFWPELVEDRKAWNAEAKRCRGIGKGTLVQIGDALESSQEMRTAYPGIYD